MDHDATLVQEVYLPLMNVARRLPDNTVNPKEPNAQKIFITSAGVKSSFAYEQLISSFENSIISPDDAFCIGMDYRIPIMHGLTDKKFINNLKMSPSFNGESFAAEYLSIWRGSSSDSWFNYDQISKYRKIKNPHWKAQKYREGEDFFYLLAVDVGRLNDRTEALVFKVNIVKDIYYASLVNLFTLGLTAETKQFAIQARDLKELIQIYNPIEVVVDTNGLGKYCSNKTLLIAGNSKPFLMA